MLESSFEVGVVTQFSALSGFYPSETASRVERSLEGENIFIQEGNFMIQAVHDIYWITCFQAHFICTESLIQFWSLTNVLKINKASFTT